MNAPCPTCHAEIDIRADKTARTGYRTDHVCAKGVSPPTKGLAVPVGGPTQGTPAARKSPHFSSAVPTDCLGGHRHASKMEARVCERLTRECAETGAFLFLQVRYPLTAIAPKPNGRPATITIDFVVRGVGAWRAIDAKSPTRISRDWRLRTQAFEATYGIAVLEVAS